MEELGSSPTGLAAAEASARVDRFGLNRIGGGQARRTVHLLVGQFTSPIVLTLIAAAILSAFLRDLADAAIILFIVIASGLLGFWQERGAANAVSELLAMVRTTVQVFRDGQLRELPLEDVVPGDVVSLSAGGVIPADGILLEATSLFLDQAALTGETFPVEKRPGVAEAEAQLGDRSNMLFMGTHVVTGTATVLITSTGGSTELGSVSTRLAQEAPPTDFQRGLRQLGILLVRFTLVLVVAIFGVNLLLKRPVLDSLLFSLALAIGLTPQLLPAIVSVNLSHGARNMAAKKVIVKRLAAIENLGSMNVLCSDKTGTLTAGTVQVHGAVDADGADSERALLAAYLNAHFESGFTNPIDEALRTSGSYELTGYSKLGEIPYDFTRKRLRVLVAEPNGGQRIVTKGALTNVLEVCASAQLNDGSTVRRVDPHHLLQRAGPGLRHGCLWENHSHRQSDRRLPGRSRYRFDRPHPRRVGRPRSRTGRRADRRREPRRHGRGWRPRVPAADLLAPHPPRCLDPQKTPPPRAGLTRTNAPRS